MDIAEHRTKPRGRPRSFDRDQALDTAMHLFWTRGYEGVSISDLTKAMDITPPSLYAAFGSKKRLFLESVELYRAQAARIAGTALAASTADEAVRRLLLGAIDIFAGKETPKGCLVVLGAINCAREADDMVEALVERRRAGREAVRLRIAAGAAAGELAEDADVDALADLVTGALYGLAIKARDGVPSIRLKASVEQLMRLWPRRAA